jgi:hypothetical protein
MTECRRQAFTVVRLSGKIFSRCLSAFNGLDGTFVQWQDGTGLWDRSGPAWVLFPKTRRVANGAFCCSETVGRQCSMLARWRLLHHHSCSLTDCTNDEGLRPAASCGRPLNFFVGKIIDRS